MAGLFGVFKEFTGARFEALRQQYSEGDPKREERFMQEKLTEKGRKVFEAIQGKGGPDTVVPPPSASATHAALPTDLPSPSGHPEGYVARDENQKVVAKIHNGQWVSP
jgi:hypothetical protein